MTSFWHRNYEPMWSKIASWTTLVGASATLCAPSSFRLMPKNKQFQPHSGQRSVLMCSNALHCDFIAHIVLKLWNQSYSDGKTNNSWWSWLRFGTENLGQCGPTLHLGRHLWYIGNLLGPLLTQFNTQKQAIPATHRPTSRSCVLQCLALRFHCTHCAQIMES